MSTRAKDTVAPPEELPRPPGWPGPAGAVSRWFGRVLTAVVVGVIAVVGAAALRVSAADLGDPGALLADAVRLLRAGPVPWTGAVGVALLLLAPAVTVGAGHPERERLVRRDDGWWALRFPAPAPARHWRSGLSALGGLCLAAVWASDVVGSGTSALFVLGAMAALGVVPRLVRTLVVTVAPHRRDRLDLTATGLEYHRRRRPVSVAWADVIAVEARARRRGESGVRREIVLVCHGGAADGWPWPRARPARREVVVPADAFAVPAERLYWACVAFLDPVRREELLDGAEITAPRP